VKFCNMPVTLHMWHQCKRNLWYNITVCTTQSHYFLDLNTFHTGVSRKWCDCV